MSGIPEDYGLGSGRREERPEPERREDLKLMEMGRRERMEEREIQEWAGLVGRVFVLRGLARRRRFECVKRAWEYMCMLDMDMDRDRTRGHAEWPRRMRLMGGAFGGGLARLCGDGRRLVFPARCFGVSP